MKFNFLNIIIAVILGGIAGILIYLKPSLALVAVAGGIVFAGILSKPGFGLHLFAVLIPLQIYLTSGSSTSFTAAKIMMNLLLLMIFIRAVKDKNFHFINAPVNIFVFLFLIVRIISVINSPNINQSLSEIQDIIGFIIVYFVALYSIRNYRDIKSLVMTILVTSGAIGLLGIFQLFGGAEGITSFMTSGWGKLFNGGWIQTVLQNEQYYWQYAGGSARIVGTFVNPDYYAAYLGYTIPLTLGLLNCRSNSRKEKIFLYFLMFILVINLLFTYSRGGWLSFGVVILFFISIFRRESKVAENLVKWIFPAGIFACLLFGLKKMFVSSGGYILERIISIPTSFLENQRWTIWEFFLDKIIEFPLIGHGFDGRFQIPALPNLNYTHSHSVFVQLTFIMGTIGLSIFLLLLVNYFVTTWNLYHHHENKEIKSILLGIMGCWVWFFIHSSVDYSFFHLKNGMMFWFVLGLSMAIYHLQKNSFKRLTNEN